MLEAIVQKRISYSSVPDQLFSADLSPVAFKVVAWALGRPNGWTFNISHMTHVLRLTDKTWPRARKELIESGFFIQKKFRGMDGKFEWTNIFTDAPLWLGGLTTPPKQGDGQTTPSKRRSGKGRNAGCRDARQENLPKEGNKVFIGVEEQSRSAAALSDENLESLIIIQNSRDEVGLRGLRAAHEDEYLKELALKIIADGHDPFISALKNAVRADKQRLAEKQKAAAEAEKDAAAKAAAETHNRLHARTLEWFRELTFDQQAAIESEFRASPLGKLVKPGSVIYPQMLASFISKKSGSELVS